MNIEFTTGALFCQQDSYKDGFDDRIGKIDVQKDNSDRLGRGRDDRCIHREGEEPGRRGYGVHRGRGHSVFALRDSLGDRGQDRLGRHRDAHARLLREGARDKGVHQDEGRVGRRRGEDRGGRREDVPLRLPRHRNRRKGFRPSGPGSGPGERVHSQDRQRREAHTEGPGRGV